MDPFVHLPRYSIVVCKTCGFGCVADEVATHLQQRHRDLTLVERRAVEQAVHRLPNLIQRQDDLCRLENPPPGIDPIPYLATPKTDGLKCWHCTFVSRQVQTMQAHCRDRHGWQNPRAKGRPPRAYPAAVLPWKENVPCQRFFPSRAGSRWFEVGRRDTGQRTNTDNRPSESGLAPFTEPVQQTPEVIAHLQSILEREQKFRSAECEPRVYSKAMGESSFANTTLWMERTKWPETFRGCRRDILRAMTRLPKRNPHTTQHMLGQGPHDGDVDILSPLEDEQKIACILQALDPVLDRCEHTATNTSRSLLTWLVSSTVNVCDMRHFKLVAEDSSQQRYRSCWKQFLAFVFRAFRLKTEIRVQETKVNISGEIWGQLQQIWSHTAWEYVDIPICAWPRKINLDKDEPTFYVRSDCEGNHLKPPESKQIDVRAVNSPDLHEDDVMTNSSDEESDSGDELFDHEEMCDTSFGSGNDSAFPDQDETDPGCGTLQPLLKSDTTAAIKACDELLELLFQLNITLCTEPLRDGQPASSLLIRFSGILGISSDSRSFLLARQYRPYTSPLIYVQRMLFLEYALPLRPYTTLGIPQRPRTHQLERLNRVREQYMVAGSQSALAELLSLRKSARVLARTEPPAFFLHWNDNGDTVYWGDKSSLRMEDFPKLAGYFVSQAEELCEKLMLGMNLEINLKQVRDDLARTDCGYSFVKHPYNGLDTKFEELLIKACTMRSEALARHGQWKWKAVSSYLKTTVLLEEMILGGLYTACGQVPRIREVLSIQRENSPSSSCGVFVWNGSVIYCIRHHKAKRVTNGEFYVARFLPARLGAVMFRYLTCIRRFADLLQRERFGCHDPEDPRFRSRLLFQSNGSAWRPSRLTAILKKATLRVWGSELNVQLYRHLAIGITEKHVREIHTPFNRYDDTSQNADLNVVLAWQSGHRPLQRGITYGLDGAYPHQLQPALLRAYEWASTRWHEFIRQPSKVLHTSPRQLSHSLTQPITPFKRTAETMPRHDSADQTYQVKRRKMLLARGVASQRACKVSTPTQEPLQSDSELHPSTSNNTHAVAQTGGRGGRVKLDNVLCIVTELRILVCLLCRTAVRPHRGIERHFRGVHCETGEALKRILSFCAGWSFEDPSTVELPWDGQPAIPELPVYGGYSCDECLLKTSSYGVFRQHYGQVKHTSTESSGSKWRKVSLQTYLGGKFARYWEVID